MENSEREYAAKHLARMQEDSWKYCPQCGIELGKCKYFQEKMKWHEGVAKNGEEKK